MPEGTPTQRAPINTDLLDADSRALLDQYFPDHNLSIILKVAFETDGGQMATYRGGYSKDSWQCALLSRVLSPLP